MTVKELIAQLSGLPGDSRVLVQGYEDGYDDISDIRSLLVQKQDDPAWYYGKYNSSVGRGEQSILLFGRPKCDDTSC